MKKGKLLSTKQKLLLLGFIKEPHEGCHTIASGFISSPRGYFDVCDDLCPFYSGTCEAFDSTRFERNDTRRKMSVE